MKSAKKKGEHESKSHWIESAKAIGMIDAETGIFLLRPMTLTNPTVDNDDENSEEEGGGGRGERNDNDEVNQNRNEAERHDGAAIPISSSTQTGEK